MQLRSLLESHALDQSTHRDHVFVGPSGRILKHVHRTW